MKSSNYSEAKESDRRVKKEIPQTQQAQFRKRVIFSKPLVINEEVELNRRQKTSQDWRPFIEGVKRLEDDTNLASKK